MRLAVLALALANCAPSAPSHFDARYSALLNQAETFPRGQVLLIGDSMSEYADVPTLCGLRVLNAGISGAKVSDWTGKARRLVVAAQPSLVLIALGANDAKLSEPRDAEEWSASYSALWRSIPGRKAAMGIAPFERPEGFDPSFPPQQNAALRSLGVALIPPVATRGQTVDGVHLNPEGRKRWAASLSAAC